jgi:pimeloyl-ACP methyl ester carboxylesterase
MPRAVLPTGIELEYETFGSPADPTLLMVSGFTAQLTSQDTELCEMFAGRGLHVVRYDNRDCGLSTKLDGVRVDPTAVLHAALHGDPIPPVPYTLVDLAADGIGLLDHLGVGRAHVWGTSMGGMIVQTMAIEHPDRVASMTSVMSMPGDWRVGQPTPEAREVLLAAPPTDRDAFVANAERSAVWASKRYVDLDRLRRNAARDFDRSFYPEGSPRQLAAMYASPDRSERLGALAVPSLVIHGRDDTLIGPDGGARTAELIPGSRFLLLADMGHDVPEPWWPTIVDAVTSLIRTASADH